MKKLIIAAALAVGMSSTAFAADSDTDIVDPVFSWGGFYGGIGIGGATFDVDDETFGGGDPSPDGFVFTGFAGYNWQIDNIVLGVEVDITGGSVEGSNGTTGGFLQPIEMNYIGTVRGRLGYSIDNLLPYITGGLAYGSFDAQHNAAPSADDVTESVTGWTIGAGVDWHIAEGWFARADYSYVDFGSTSFDFANGADIHDVDIDGSIFRISFAKKF